MGNDCKTAVPHQKVLDEMCIRDSRYSIYAALQLYLDFINIFLYLIRLLGYANRD